MDVDLRPVKPLGRVGHPGRGIALYAEGQLAIFPRATRRHERGANFIVSANRDHDGTVEVRLGPDSGLHREPKWRHFAQPSPEVTPDAVLHVSTHTALVALSVDDDEIIQVEGKRHRLHFARRHAPREHLQVNVGVIPMRKSDDRDGPNPAESC